MIWLTWRQFRAQLLVAGALVAAACVWLAVTGPHLARLARDNQDVYDLLGEGDQLLYKGGIVVLAVAPALLGVFWGAPQVARELETGTYRLAWNQSVTRRRWLATKLASSALAAAVAVGLLTLAVTWWSHPLDGALGDARGNLPSRMTPVAFAMRGIVPVGYAVFAVMLGTFVGLVLRRTVAAMALTLAVYVLLQIAVPFWVRPHLVTPVTTTEKISRSTFDGLMSSNSGDLRLTLHTGDSRDWVIVNQTIDPQGHPVHQFPSWFYDCLPGAPGAPSPGAGASSQAGDPLDQCLDRLTSEGYRQRVVYQPIGHFWRLQAAETGLYLVVSAGLAGLSFWWLRRRLS